MKTYYGYIRVSTARQGERGSSLHEQREAIQQYAQKQGLVISEWFEERETAAKRGRTVFNRMLAALENGSAIGVVIHKIDRSARNLRDWSDLGELIDCGIEVHFAHESLDLHSRGGRLAADIQAVVASDYIRNLRDEVRKGFYGRLKQGYYPLPAPLGYDDNGAAKQKTLNPQSAQIVRKAFELYSSGDHSLGTLQGELTRLGLKNRRGKQVSLNGISSILNNPFYVGLIRIEKTGEYFQGNHQPLISKALFERVQDALQGKRKIRKLKHAHTYQKMFRCENCEYSLIAEHQKGFTYYRCHTASCPTTSFREEALERKVFDALRQFTFTHTEIAAFAEEFKRFESKTVANQEAILQSLKLSLEQVEKRLEALTDAYIDRMVDKETFDARKAKLLLEKAEYVEKRDELASGKDVVNQKVQNFLELIGGLSDMGEIANPAEKRDLLKSMTSNLCVSPNSLAIVWRFPFDVLAKSEFITCGGPQRGICRTLLQSEPPPYLGRISMLAKETYDAIVKSCFAFPELPKEQACMPTRQANAL